MRIEIKIVSVIVFWLVISLASATLSTYVTISGSATVMTTTLDHVVFSEVFYDTPGTETDEEWIELYNPTSDSVDLSNFTIQDNADTYTIPDGTSIASHEFLVIARDQTAFENLYGSLPDISGLTLSLANGGDVLRLMDDAVEIDMVAWEDYEPGWNLVADEGESIQRDPPDQDNDIAGDWTSHASPDPG